jgi:hypothetical protein
MLARFCMIVVAAACGRVGFDVDANRTVDTTPTSVCAVDPTWTPEWSSVIAYLPFDGAGSIATANAVTARIGPTATASNLDGAGMAYVAGKVGQAIRFDGVDDFVALNLPTIDTTAGRGVSVGFWMNWNGTYYMPSGWTVLINFTNVNLLLDNQGTPPNTLGFNTNRGDNWGASNVGLENRWSHVVAVFHNGMSDQSQLFIDGEMISAMQTEGSAGPATVSAAIKIGAYPTYPNFFPGALDEITIWNRMLTAAEVSDLYDHQVACN